MEEKIQKYYLTQLHIFEKDFAALKKDYDEEAIHKMRVSIKRLRALFLFLEYIEPVQFNSKKELKLVRRIFKLTGKIRDVQIQKGIIGGIRDTLDLEVPDLLRYLQKNEQKAINEFRENIGGIIKKAPLIDSKKVTGLIKGLSDNQEVAIRTIRLLNEKISRIDLLRKDLENIRDVHEIRIHLKQIHYLFDFTQDYFSRKLFLKMPLKRLKRIETIYGEWHDRVNVISMLNLFFKETGRQEDPKYKLLYKRVMTEKEMLHEQIRYIMRSELLFQFVLEI